MSNPFYLPLLRKRKAKYADVLSAIVLIILILAQSLRSLLLQSQQYLRLRTIENPLKKSPQQRTFLGLSIKCARHETCEWRPAGALCQPFYFIPNLVQSLRSLLLRSQQYLRQQRSLPTFRLLRQTLRLCRKRLREYLP